MRHAYFGKKLSRTTDERKQLFRNLVRSLFLHGSIQTTKAKAVAVRSLVEKIITRAKKGQQSDYRLVLATVKDANIAHIVMEEAKTRFAARTSGYTRILRLGKMGQDARDMVLFSFVDERIAQEVIPVKKEIKKDSKEVTAKVEKPKKEEKKKKTSKK